MQALRAQMNPHFIFNSLNSIENFIMQNEKRLASDYLNKFARLITDDTGQQPQRSGPGGKRYGGTETCILNWNNYGLIINSVIIADVDPELMNGDYKVPSLLIQPYVENAIVHGIAHSEKGNLQLFVNASAGW